MVGFAKLIAVLGTKFMLKPLSATLLAAVLLSSASVPAGAFKSFTAFGGAVHDQITRSALGKAGFKEASLKFIDKSCYGQDVVGTPAFTESKRHFDDCELKASHDYVESCYLDIDKHVCAAGKNSADKKSVLKSFGELLHTVQDFYSHSNYVELALKRNSALRPDAIPLVDWQSLVSPNAALRTGHFYYVAINDNEEFAPGTLGMPTATTRDEVISKLIQHSQLTPGTKYLPSKDYAKQSTFAQKIDYTTDKQYSYPHRDLNKDNAGTDQGKVSNPATSVNLHNYALQLAIRDTARQWERLEKTIKAKCSKDASGIIAALKQGPPEGKVNLTEISPAISEKLVQIADEITESSGLAAYDMKGGPYDVEIDWNGPEAKYFMLFNLYDLARDANLELMTSNLRGQPGVRDLMLGGEPAKQSGPAKYAPRKTYQSQLLTMSGNKYLRFQVDLPDWTKDGQNLCGANMERFSKAGMAAVKKNAFPSVKLKGTK